MRGSRNFRRLQLSSARVNYTDARASAFNDLLISMGHGPELTGYRDGSWSPGPQTPALFDTSRRQSTASLPGNMYSLPGINDPTPLMHHAQYTPRIVPVVPEASYVYQPESHVFRDVPVDHHSSGASDASRPAAPVPTSHHSRPAASKRRSSHRSSAGIKKQDLAKKEEHCTKEYQRRGVLSVYTAIQGIISGEPTSSGDDVASTKGKKKATPKTDVMHNSILYMMHGRMALDSKSEVEAYLEGVRTLIRAKQARTDKDLNPSRKEHDIQVQTAQQLYNSLLALFHAHRWRPEQLEYPSHNLARLESSGFESQPMTPAPTPESSRMGSPASSRTDDSETNYS